MTHRRVLQEKENGFSLVELLVVISIIALLAAIILPGLSRAREYAYFSLCKNNLRQIGIGMLIYGSDNRGRLPYVDNLCDGGSYYTARKIGGLARWDWPLGGNAQIGRHVYDKMYVASSVRQDWYGADNSSYRGRPRERGRYLPIEIFWDPIVKVRNWGPWGKVWNWGSGDVPLYSGTERERDCLGRRWGVWGYYLYVCEVNCATYRNDSSWVNHLLKIPWNPSQTGSYYNIEGPNTRPDTKNRNITSSAAPAAWVASCHTPIVTATGGVPRVFRSHFGWRQTVTGAFRFNVLHIDGHVHDDIWRETGLEDGWLITGTSVGGWYRPYGWFDKAIQEEGFKETPEFEGSFDQNKGELRRVGR